MTKNAQQTWSQPSGEASPEWVSALMDGELDHQESMHWLARMKTDPHWREDWQTYHLIGDAMRQMPCLSRDFGQRLSQRLAEEPTVLAPKRSLARRPLLALSAAASVAVISFALWQVRQESGLNTTVPDPAQGIAVASLPRQQPRNVSEYLIAHQEYSSGIAMQGVAPYVRAVYETQGETGR